MDARASSRRLDLKQVVVRLPDGIRRGRQTTYVVLVVRVLAAVAIVLVVVGGVDALAGAIAAERLGARSVARLQSEQDRHERSSINLASS